VGEALTRGDRIVLCMGKQHCVLRNALWDLGRAVCRAANAKAQPSWKLRQYRGERGAAMCVNRSFIGVWSFRRQIPKVFKIVVAGAKIRNLLSGPARLLSSGLQKNPAWIFLHERHYRPSQGCASCPHRAAARSCGHCYYADIDQLDDATQTCMQRR